MIFLENGSRFPDHDLENLARKFARISNIANAKYRAVTPAENAARFSEPPMLLTQGDDLPVPDYLSSNCSKSAPLGTPRPEQASQPGPAL